MKLYTSLNHSFEQENGYACKKRGCRRAERSGIPGRRLFQADFHPVRRQKTRVALGKLLLNQPDILLLDEPTNHLDMDSIRWLETYLLNYPGAVFIVSHDRYFLDKVVTKIIEIDQAQVHAYLGNYSDYSQKKAQIRDAQYKAYLNQQQEIRHQKAVIAKLRSFNREKSIRRAESREKMLEKMDVMEKPVMDEERIRIQLEPRIQERAMTS